MNIGFVGVGRMGANMARRLKDRQFHITAVYDTNRAAAISLAAELGCAAAQDLSQVTAACDVIFTVVTDDNAMRTVFAGTGDNLLVNARGKLFINCATISPQVHVDVEKLAHRAGAETLEACMASSITQAREGKLYLMCGGNEETFHKAEPILKELAAKIRFIGKAGEAAKVKALVNMVMNINTAGLAEGLGLGAALGLDLTMLREVFSQTGANSRVLETDGEDMQNREHSCFFSVAHAAKDSGIALDLARSLGLDLPLARATKEQYDRMVADGLGELDKSGIAELTFKDRQKHSGDRM
ncbi:MAG: 2-hydroxy-3-oxopropionate reductase [Verrucomicrobia bacterium]|nr:MAG: 2-hydroxy-3-oxopropionate reductase [Verrucomicrobiota bacterium]